LNSAITEDNFIPFQKEMKLPFGIYKRNRTKHLVNQSVIGIKLTACPPPFAMTTDKVSAAVTSLSLI
jgi:hypothetical protein